MHSLRFVLPILILFGSITANAQTRICPNNVPFEVANLTGNPDSVWISNSNSRSNQCCGSSNPDRCIEFIITLDPGAQGIKFDIASGGAPPGALFYQVNCGVPVAVGQAICLSGVGPFNITFCKPGNNPNSYKITSIAKPSVSPPTVVSDGCSGTIFSSGYQQNTITWRSVPNNPLYDAYLSATSGQDTISVNFAPGAPAFVDYEVCGTPIGACVGNIICDTVRVQFINTLSADIQPKNASICFGSLGSSLTATGVGGLAPFSYTWSTGQTTQSIVAPTAGTYSVIIDDATSCPIAFDTVVVTAFPSTIIATAPVDRIECNNTNPFSIQLSGSIQSATGGIWTSTGAGTFSPNNTTLNAIYLPSAAEITAGTTLLTLTTTGNGTCPADTDQVFFRIRNAPIVIAGNPITVCANNSNVTLNGSVSGITTTGIWSSSGTGTFNPNNITLNATYLPSNADKLLGNVTLTLTSTNNGLCNPVISNLALTITAAPVVNANSNQTVCANNSNVLLNGSVTGSSTTGIWTTNGTGTFNPNNTTLNATYIPSVLDRTNGTVQLILSSSNNGNCNIVRDTMLITITNSPIVNAGTNITRCKNNLGNITLNGSVTSGAITGIWTTTNGTGTFSPNNTTLNANYVPSNLDLTNGFVDLILSSTGNSAGTCLVVRDTVQINFTNSPIVNAGLDQTDCANNINFNLSGTINGGASTGIWASSGTGSFLPSNTTLICNYIPSIADIVANIPIRIILTSTGNTAGSCTAVSDTLFLNISPSPIVNAGIDLTICASNTTINLSGSVSAGASTGIWSTTNGTGTFSPNNTTLNATYNVSANDILNGSVTFVLSSTGNTGGLCNTVRDTVIFTIAAKAIVNAGVNIVKCKNNIGTISLTGTVTAGATTGSWTTTGTGTFSSPNSLTTNYTASIADINSNLPIQLILTSTGNTGGLCSAVSDSLVLTFTAAPNVNAGSNQTVCANNIVAGIQLNGIISGGASAGIWTSSGTGSFSPNNTTLSAVYFPSISDINSGSVNLKLKSTNHGITNCSIDSAIILISINPSPIVNAGSNQTICANAANAIALNGTVSGGATTGTWTTSGTGTFANANSLITTYTLSTADKLSSSINFTLTSTGNSSGTCIAVNNVMTLTITPAPIVNAGLNQTVCKNNPIVTLSGSVTAGATTGTWSSPNGTGLFGNANLLNTNYTPSSTDLNNGSTTIILTSTGNTGGTCVAVKDTMVIFYSPTPIVNAGTDQTVCANNSIISLNGLISGGATTGIWTCNGTNIINNANLLNASYTPSATDISNGSVRFILTSTGNTGGTCIAVSDTLFVTIGPSPIVNAGADINKCSNNLGTINLNGTVSGGATTGTWSTTGTGVFIPNSNTLNATYIPSNADILASNITLILSSTGNSNGTCLQVKDSTSLTILAKPNVNAGSNVTVCANNSSIINLSGIVNGGASTGIWSSNGTGIFGNNTNLNTTYTLSNLDKTNGSVIIKLKSTGNSGGLCNADSSNITITIIPPPIVSAGIDKSICSSITSVNLNGSVIGGASTGTWTTSGTGTFNPNANSLNAIYTPSATDISNGNVFIVLHSTGNSGNLCNVVTDTLQLTILPSASVNAGLDQPICKIQSSILLNGQISGNTTTGFWTTTGSGTFVPNANTKNATYLINASDTLLSSIIFILTSTNNGSCLVAIDTMRVTFSNSDDPGFTYSSGTFCFDDPANKTPVIPILATGSSGIFTSSPAGLTLNSTTGSINVSTSALGIYNVKFKTNGPCPDSSVVAINITNSPSANFSYPGTFCKGSANALPVFALGASAGFFTSNSSNIIFINQNTGEIDIYNSIPGTYTITNTIPASGTCPSSTASNTITINNWVKLSTTQNLKSVCANNSLVNIDASFNVGSPITTGSWKSNGDGVFGNANTTNTTYTAGNNDKTNGTVILRFVSDDPIGICTSDSVTVQVNISPSPIVDAGLNDTICAANTFIPLNGNINGGATTGIWSTNGTGIFTPNNSTLNANYIFSLQDRLNGSVKLFLTSTGNTNNACIAVVDSVTYHIILDPVIQAGADQNLCFNQDTIQLNGSITGSVTTGIWSSTGSGFFLPNNNALQGKYIPSLADKNSGNFKLILTSNVATTICSFVNDTVNINISNPTVVNAGPNKIVCANNSLITLNGTVTGVTTTGIWKTNGDGTFNSVNTNLINSYIPGALDLLNGSVLLRLVSTNNISCNPDSDFVQITITPGPIVNAGIDQSICKNNLTINLNGTVSAGANKGKWTTTGSGIFLPNDSTLAASYVPSISDLNLNTVTLILSSTGNSNNTCLLVRDSLTINFTLAPILNAGIDKQICENSILPVSINGSIGGGITKAKWTSLSGDGTFLPNDSALIITYTLGPNDINNGSVTLILSSTDHTVNSCLALNDSMQIFVLPAASVNAGLDRLVCMNTNVSLNGIVSNGASTGIWKTSNGTGSFLPSINNLNATYIPSNNDYLIGNINIILESTGNSNGICIPVSDTFLLNFIAVPIVDAGPNQLVCADVSTVQLNGSVTVTTTNGIWTSNGTGTFFPNNTTLNATYAPSSLDTANGLVKLFLTSIGGPGTCTNTVDSLTINFTPAPIIVAGLNGSVCINNPTIGLSGLVTGASNTGLWKSSGDGIFTPNNLALNASYQPGINDLINGNVLFTLLPSNIGTCVLDSSQIQYLFTPIPIVDAGVNQSVCANESQINLSGIVNQGATTGRWTTNGTGQFSPNDSSLNAIYLISAADKLLSSFKLYLTSTGNTNNTCLSASDSITVTIVPAVQINLTDTFNVCANNSSVNLQPIINGVSTSILWTTTGSGSFIPNNTTLNATYLPSVIDTSNRQVTLKLTIGNLGGCLNSNDSSIIIISPAPRVIAGQNITVCANKDSVFLNGNIFAGASSGTWVSNGTGTFFPNANSLNAIYIPSNADVSSGNIRMILNSTGNTLGTCLSRSDTLFINITAAPIVQAGSNQTVCVNNSSIQLTGNINGGASTGIWTSSGTGIFLPNNAVLNPIYVPSPNDLTLSNVQLILTSFDHGLQFCNSVSDTMQLNFTLSPLITLVDTLLSCITDNSVNVISQISQGATTGVWISLGSGNFAPNNTDLNINYLPSAQDKLNGSVKLVLNSTGNTAGTCLSESDTVTIIFTPLIFTDEDDTIQVCKNNLIIQLNGNITGGSNTGRWISSGTGNFIPNDTTLNAQYILSSNDTLGNNILLRLLSTNNGGCDTSESKLLIDFLPAPKVFSGPDLNICSNSGLANLSGVIIGAASKGIWTSTGTGTFLPNDTILNPVYIPSSADFNSGQITLRLTTRDHTINSCNSEFDEMNINLYVSATVSAGQDRYVCYNDTSVLLFANASGANPFRYFWSNGETTPNIEVGPGIYYIRIQDINDCIPTYDTVVVYAVDTNIIAKAGNDSTICIKTDSVLLNGQILGFNQGHWQGLGVFSPDSDALNAVYYPTITEKTQGFFDLILIPSDETGCTFTNDTIRFNFLNVPSENINGPNVVCLANAISNYQTNLVIGQNYNWIATGGTILGSNTNNTVSVQWGAAGGTLTLNISNVTGCDTTLTMNVSNVGMLKPSIVGTLSVCNNSALQQIYSVNNNIGNTYAWSCSNGSVISGQNSNNATIQWLGSGQLIITETGNLGCEIKDTIDFIFSPLLASTISLSDASGCAPLDVNFNINTLNPEPLIYKWIINEDTLIQKNPNYQFQNPGNYPVQFILSNGTCTDTTNTNITVFEDPIAEFNYLNAPTDSLDFPTDTLWIFNTSEINADYFWDFGDGNTDTIKHPIHKFNQAGSYQIVLRVTDRTTGCVSYFTRPFTLEVNSNLNSPTVFTPNGDGINDKFRIYEKNLRNFRILIFDRWGSIIYTSNDPNFEWDGTYNGNECTVGAYVYHIIAIGEDNSDFIRTSIISIVR